MKGRWSHRGTAGTLALALCASTKAARADDTPTQWEQLFFPFPLVGAPPQLEQQIQLFNSVFTGSRGGGEVPSAELAWIASAHLGLVLTVPAQFGFGGQETGLQDSVFLLQWLVTGSLRYDNMLSMGVQTIVPTATSGLGGGDVFVGPFVYAVQRLWKHFIMELDLTGQLPVIYGTSARQIAVDGLLSVLVTRVGASFPVYVQVEADETVYLGGTTAASHGDDGACAHPISRSRGVSRTVLVADLVGHARRGGSVLQRGGRSRARGHLHGDGSV